MFSNFSEAALYLQKNLNTYDPNNPLEEEEARDMLFDAVFASIDDATLERSLTDTDKELLQSDSADEAMVLSILSNRIPNFYALLTDTVADIIDEYMWEQSDIS